MTTVNQLVAVYGTLKRGHGNNRLLQSADFRGTGTVFGCRLFSVSFPYCVKDTTSDYLIQVEVYNATPAEVTRMDALEGHPSWYRREVVDVHMHDGTVLKAWIYIMPRAGVPKSAVELTDGVY